MPWRVICPNGHVRDVAEDEADGPLHCPDCASWEAVPPPPRPDDLRHLPELVCRAVATPPSTTPTALTESAALATGGSRDGATKELPRIPGYDVLDEVGRGGMGVVYRARQHGLNRIVALKMLHGSGRDRDEEGARLRIEAEALARLRHPSVVRIHEVGEADGRPFLVLEFIEGGSLAQRLRGGPLAPRAAAQMVATLADAIHAAHGVGVIHRDLKPANVLLDGPSCDVAPPSEKANQALTPKGTNSTEFGNPKITDFGLAKCTESGPELTGTGQVLGTPCYLAPEQASGLGRLVGAPADVYALGAILYELLTGRPPFQAASTLETLEQVRSCEPVPPSRLRLGLPRDLQTICLKCLAKEPRQRYASAAALAEDLGRYVRGEPIVARPVGSVERVMKWSRRHPAAAALITFALLAALAAVAGLFGHNWALRQQVAEAQRQKRIALENFRRGYDVLEKLALDLEVELHRTGQSSAIQRILAGQWRTRLAFYRNALDQADLDDPEVRMARASARTYAGGMLTYLDQPAEGLADLEAARTEMEKLVAGQPSNVKFRRQLSRCQYALGFAQFHLKNFAEAERLYCQSLANMKIVLDADGDFPRALTNQAETCYQLARLYQTVERWPELECTVNTALEHFHKLVEREPRDDGHRLRLADVQGCALLLYGLQGRWRDVATAVGDAEAALQPLLIQEPPHVGAALAMAQLRRAWGRSLLVHRQHEAAAEQLTVSITILEKALSHAPWHEMVRRQLADACHDQAIAFTELNRGADAERLWRTAINHAEGTTREAYVSEFLAAGHRGVHPSHGLKQDEALRLADQHLESARRQRMDQRTQEAEDMLRQAEAALGAAHGASASRSALWLRAEVEFEWAELAMCRGALEEALERYDKSLAALDGILNTHPDDAAALNARAYRHRLKAWHLSRAGRTDQAFAAWDRAIELAVGADRAFIRAERALELALLGHHAAATAEADEVLAARELPTATLIHLARVHAAAIEALERDHDLNSAERQRRLEAYAASAAAALRRVDATQTSQLEALLALDGEDRLAALRRTEAYRAWRTTLPR